jgi:hypothetical protein
VFLGELKVFFVVMNHHQPFLKHSRAEDVLQSRPQWISIGRAALPVVGFEGTHVTSPRWTLL